MSELLSKINTNTGLIFSLKDQIDVSNAFLQQEITDLQNNKYDKTGGLISGDVEIQATQSIQQTIGTLDTYNLEMKIVGIDGYATFNRFPVLSVKPGETEGIQIGIDGNFTTNIVRGIGLNPLKITQNEASEETDYIEVGNFTGVANIVMTEKINLQTENITFTGAGLQSNSAGGNSGQHLRIFVNGTEYKIKLENA